MIMSIEHVDFFIKLKSEITVERSTTAYKSINRLSAEKFFYKPSKVCTWMAIRFETYVERT